MRRTHPVLRLAHATLSRLLLGLQRLPVRAVVTFKEAQMRQPLAVGVKLRNHVHELQQVAVVANNERRARQCLQRGEELSLRRGVKVIRRLIEQDELGVRNHQRGKCGDDRLTAGEAAHTASKECANRLRVVAINQCRRGESVGRKSREGALLNIPVIPDGLIEFGGVFAGFHRL